LPPDPVNHREHPSLMLPKVPCLDTF
jgi:hypothetical protein